ncbi:hypothetical protein [Jeotgalibacillus proteolyticus]|uniref:hypothetical protein n=1 Tax=Jeotgalibacillus proteolyticus TaxID=2082395 RepID=UPI003CFB25B5
MTEHELIKIKSILQPGNIDKENVSKTDIELLEKAKDYFHHHDLGFISSLISMFIAIQSFKSFASP